MILIIVHFELKENGWGEYSEYQFGREMIDLYDMYQLILERQMMMGHLH